MDQVFNKGLDFSEKSEGLLKRLENIEGKTDNQLRAIEGQRNNQLSLVENNTIKLDQVEYVLLYGNIVQNDYLQNAKLVYEFVPDKKFGQLIYVKPPVSNQCITLDSIFDYIEILFTDQSNKSLQIKDKVSVALIIQNNRL